MGGERKMLRKSVTSGMFLWIAFLIIGCALPIARSFNAGNLSPLPSPTDGDDPCLFVISMDANPVNERLIESRQQREINGYAAEIELSEAVRLFNREQSCYKGSAEFPPVTEDEIIAATSTSADYNQDSDAWVGQKGDLLAIRERRVLPKGSLLVGEVNGPVFDIASQQQTKITAKGQRIYLLFSLDINSRLEGVLPSRAFLIRKLFKRIDDLQVGN